MRPISLPSSRYVKGPSRKSRSPGRGDLRVCPPMMQPESAAPAAARRTREARNLEPFMEASFPIISKRDRSDDLSVAMVVMGSSLMVGSEQEAAQAMAWDAGDGGWW